MAAEQVDLAVARAVWVAGDTVVDVRLPGEYASGHIAGAINIPVDLLAARQAELGPGQVLAVCSLGGRSWRAAELLGGAGREALSLRGGTKAWQAAGLPIVRGPEPGERATRRTGGRPRAWAGGVRRLTSRLRGGSR